MTTLESLNFENLYCLFKGEPGTRKSSQALSFPKPIEWVNWDRKRNALALPMRAWNINPKDVDVRDYKDWDGAKNRLEQLLVSCSIKSLVIDSVTSGGDSMVRQTLKTKGGGKMIGTIQVGGFDEWNAESSALTELIALTKDIHESKKVNIILIAHVVQKEMKSADGKTHMARVLVTAGKVIAQKIPAYCDEVYHFNIKGGAIVGAPGKYALLTQHTGDDFARTTLPLDREIEFGDEPLYEKFLLPAINKMNSPQQPTTTNKGQNNA